MGTDLTMVLASELVLIRRGKRGKGKVDITRWNNPLPKSHWTAETLPITVNQNGVICPSLTEVLMSRFAQLAAPIWRRPELRSRLAVSKLPLLALLLLVPVAAHAQGSPFDTGFNALQTLFTGTVAKVASLIPIVIGGYGFAHCEPGADKPLAGVAAGTGIAGLAVNVLSWLWGV